MAKKSNGESSSNVRDIFFQNLADVIKQHAEVSLDEVVTDDTLIQDFGLDSVAFSDLVSRLERDVGFIPESILDGTGFPNTIAEFLALYEKH